eukprot:7807598-Lingulodinium_polyedra.AAC.1
MNIPVAHRPFVPMPNKGTATAPADGHPENRSKRPLPPNLTCLNHPLEQTFGLRLWSAGGLLPIGRGLPQTVLPPP